MAKRKNGPVHTRVESTGVKQRFGRPVRDATDDLVMPLLKRDIERAAKRRLNYEVDEPENFRQCVLATCISKAAGAEVLIMRRHAYIALPGDEYALRYEVDPKSTDIIHLNDEGRFADIPANVFIRLRPPSPSRRLVKMRAKSHAYRHSPGDPVRTERKQRQVDPFRGVWRNGQFAAEEL